MEHSCLHTGESLVILRELGTLNQTFKGHVKMEVQVSSIKDKHLEALYEKSVKVIEK